MQRRPVSVLTAHKINRPARADRERYADLNMFEISFFTDTNSSESFTVNTACRSCANRYRPSRFAVGGWEKNRSPIKDLTAPSIATNSQDHRSKAITLAFEAQNGPIRVAHSEHYPPNTLIRT
jgi:hypothetical protein